MKKRQLFKEAFVASLLVIGIDMLLSFVPWKFELIKPIKQGFNDFDIYDLRYSGSDSMVDKKDTNITILGIGDTREEIASEINKVAALHPRIIGIDAIFFGPGKKEADSVLVDALQRAKNVVVASKFTDETDTDFIQKNFFTGVVPGVQDGFFNFVEGQEDIKRHFAPFLSVHGDSYPSFTARMLQTLSPGAYDKLLARGKPVETIHFSGNKSHYNIVPFDKFLHPDKEDDLDAYFKDKIVFIGFCKDHEPDVLEDIHFTPMNNKHGGKSFPDMYGVIIHANILEMMLAGHYIHEMPLWLVYLLTLCLLFVINVFYIRILSGSHRHNHLALFLFQIIFALVLIYIALLFFSWFDFKMDLMPVIIAVVLSFEIFWLYELLALKMKKLFNYETFVRG